MNYKQDKLITALTKNKKINAYLTFIKNTARTAQVNHNLNIISSSIFCRAMTACVLLSGNLKNKNDILSLRWNCTGPSGTIFIEANHDGHVKGYIDQPDLVLIENSLSGNSIKSEPYIGLGELIVSRRTYDNRPPYNSISVIETGEIAEDISIYLKQSLQIKSDINIALSIKNTNEIEICAGILLMAMPGTTEEELSKVHNDFLSLGSFTNLLKTSETGYQNILSEIIKKLNLIVISEKPIEFKCNCSKIKILNYLKTLDKNEFVSFISDDGKIIATCKYCNKNYMFLPEEV